MLGTSTSRNTQQSPRPVLGVSLHSPKAADPLLVSLGRAAVPHCRNCFKTNTIKVFQRGPFQILEGTATLGSPPACSCFNAKSRADLCFLHVSSTAGQQNLQRKPAGVKQCQWNLPRPGKRCFLKGQCQSVWCGGHRHHP